MSAGARVRPDGDGPVIATMLGAGLLLGLAADRLLWDEPTGPGLALWMALLGAAAVLLAHRQGWPWARATAGWATVAVLGAAGTAWRAAPALQLLFLGVVLVAASAVILEARGRRLGRTRVTDHVYGLALVPWSAGVGALSLLARAELPDRRTGRRAAAVGRGVLLAVPPVIVFASLLAAADPGFGRAVGRLIPDVELLPRHVFLVGFFGWVGAGLLGGVLPGRRRNPLSEIRLPRVGLEETATVLGLVGAVFLGYIVIQFTYLFGGTAAIEAASGLTLAEYARRGFFELMAVAGLVLALLLAAHAAAPRQGAGRRAYRLLGGVLVVLVMAIIASAALRVRLYIAEFGLTAARYYAAAVMVWIAVALALFAGTVLRSRPRPFATGALLAGLVVVAGLAAVNPDARIARTNLALETRPVDGAYLARLSADAVPVVLRGLDGLGRNARCTVARTYVDRWGPDAVSPDGDDWRTWNAATARARSAVRARLPELRTTADACG